MRGWRSAASTTRTRGPRPIRRRPTSPTPKRGRGRRGSSSASPTATPRYGRTGSMARPSQSSEPGLVCPSCATAQASTERVCPQCGIPLVHTGVSEEPAADSPRERARKIKPQLSEGRLVKVAGAHNQAEAEFLQGLLLEEGVPSTLRRAAGFDVPDFLAAGPRDVLVPASGVAVARDVLLESDLGATLPGASGVDAPWRVLAGVLIAVALVAIIAWIGTELFV